MLKTNNFKRRSTTPILMAFLQLSFMSCVGLRSTASNIESKVVDGGGDSGGDSNSNNDDSSSELSHAQLVNLLSGLFVHDTDSSTSFFQVTDHDKLNTLLESDQVDFVLTIGKNVTLDTLVYPVPNNATYASMNLSATDLHEDGDGGFLIDLGGQNYILRINDVLTDREPSYGDPGNLYVVKMFAIERGTSNVLADFSGTVEIVGTKK